jgi:hypothetical protein
VRVTTVHSTGRTETGVLRMLDGRRRTIIVMAPWDQSLAETFRRIRDQLTPEEMTAVLEAFRLDSPPESA